LRGQTDSTILEEKKINIWKKNTSREFLDKCGLKHLPVGDMGPSYGFLFRHFGAKYINCKSDYKDQGYDQLANVIKLLKTDPNSRRMIISLWDPNALDHCPLPPCLYNYQFYAHNNTLSCMMTQRSSDFVVAGGWNIATGSLLTILIANIVGMEPHELIWNIGDLHIYNNLIEEANINTARPTTVFPKLYVKKRDNIEDFEFSDLELLNYKPESAIKTIMNA
jgi:thymidylate synthase